MCGHLGQAHLNYQGGWQTMYKLTYQGMWQTTRGNVRQAHLPRRVATNVWKRKTSSLTKAGGKQCVDT